MTHKLELETIHTAKAGTSKGAGPMAVDGHTTRLKTVAASPASYFHMGNALRGENRLDDAISCYQRAVSLAPVFAEAYNNMGLVFQEKGDLEASIHCFQKALESNPKLFHAYFNMGVSFKDREDVNDAVFCFQKALLLRPKLSSAYNRLGTIFREQWKLDKALFCFKKELEIDPKNAQAYNNLGSTFYDTGAVSEAVRCFQNSLRLRPDHVETHWNLSLAHLALGNYAEGWCGYEYRFKRNSHRPSFPEQLGIPRWDGTSFVGKRLLVLEEQGLGDNLQFVRYLPMVKARGGTVLLKTDKRLLNLFRGIEGLDEIEAWPSDTMPSVDFDFYIPMMSLPWIFGTTLATIPARVPYIRPDQQKVDAWRERINGKGMKVGLVWACSPTSPTELISSRGRSCHLMHFLPLSRIPGISLYGLQKGEAAGQVRELCSHHDHIINLGEAFEDFSDTAAAIANLDLMISIDTSVAHLSGAMGKPTWLLLQSVSDFRWLRQREDSPWYPTMRLFRQERPGHWAGVIGRVCSEVRSRLSRGPGTP